MLTSETRAVVLARAAVSQRRLGRRRRRRRRSTTSSPARQIGVAARASREQVDGAVRGARTRSSASVSTGSAAIRSCTTPRRSIERAPAGIRRSHRRRGRLSGRRRRQRGQPHHADASCCPPRKRKRLVGEMVPIESAPGQRAPPGLHDPRAARRRVRHHVVQLAAEHGGAQGRRRRWPSGNTVVIKPPQPTPFSAALLFELLLEAGLPPGPRRRCCRGRARRSAPGSSRTRTSASSPSPAAPRSGRLLQRSVGLRPITLELGSISATIVCDDADLERAAPRCVSVGIPSRRPGLHVHCSGCSSRTPSIERFMRAAGRRGEPH